MKNNLTKFQIEMITVNKKLAAIQKDIDTEKLVAKTLGREPDFTWIKGYSER
jgi:hypothetical protein